MRQLLTFVLATLLYGTFVACAHASGRDVIKDCNYNETLTKRYTQADYREALKNLPSDVDQYSDCRSLIENAIRTTGLSSRRSSGGGGDSSANSGKLTPWGQSKLPKSAAGTDPLSLAKPEEQAAYRKVAKTKGRPVRLDNGKPVAPDQAASISGLSGLPTPLLLALALIVTGIFGAATYLISNRVRDFRRRRSIG